MKYRADIDGLRAIAVVSVVFYHFGIPHFGGGFVGVDVFFVISGYLITSLITHEIAGGRFKILNFYQRRSRRIFPALYAVMIFCAVSGFIIFPPEDLRHLGQAIVATTLFLSNVLFWLQSGYFAARFDELPLLHTWSLAVEEQFYATFPIYLLCISKFMPSYGRTITLALCVISFAVSAWLVYVFPVATFYLAPTRAWELLIGALLAINFLPIIGTKWHRIAGGVGLVMITAAVLLYSDLTPFPGAAALLPVLGAACVIWGGEANADNFISRMLSTPPIVFLGKVSYSFYLWHFSLLAFASFLIVSKLSPIATFAVLTFSLGVSVLSWLFVEQPFRRPQNGLSQNSHFFLPVAVATCIICGLGLSAYFTGGFPSRLTPADMRILAEAHNFDADRLNCMAYGPVVPGCPIGPKSKNPQQFALWGDSHAETLRPAFDDLAVQFHKTGVFLGRAGCAPLIRIRRTDKPECMIDNEQILHFILSTPSIDTVVLSARWGLWAEGSRYKKENRNPAIVLLEPEDEIPATARNNHRYFAFGLRETITALRAAGKQVWLIGPVPEIGYLVPKAIYIERLGINRRVEIRPTYKEYKQRQSFVIDLFDQLQKDSHVRVIWPDSLMCKSLICEIELNREPIYIDDNHLSVYGAKSLEPILKRIFEQGIDAP